MKYLFILILLPSIVFSQQRKGTFITTEYSMADSTMRWFQTVFPSMIQKKEIMWVKNGYRFNFDQDTVSFSKYAGRRLVKTDTLAGFVNGVIVTMITDSLKLKMSQIAGTVPIEQIPAIPYSKVSGGPVLSGNIPVPITRSFNTPFTVSATRDAWVSYTVSVQLPLTILGIIYGIVYLDISINGTAWTEVGRLSNGNSTLAGFGLRDGQLQYRVPAGWQVRLRSVRDGTNTVTITYNNGTETILN